MLTALRRAECSHPVLIKYAVSVNIMPLAQSEADWLWTGGRRAMPGTGQTERATITWTTVSVEVYVMTPQLPIVYCIKRLKRVY